MTSSTPMSSGCRGLCAAVAVAGLVLTAACGAGSSGGQAAATPTSPSAAESAPAHNAADISFATDMIPHHSQAVEMADMAIAKASNADVKALAVKIKAAQDPEIVTMTGWLRAWNQPVPPSSMSGMSGMSSSTGMGMMSDADMASLDRATGKAFDTMWVSMMITHHQGAVDMSKTELASGQYAGAKTLAQSIVTSQTAQIAQLQTLKTKLA
jgi:uncharacterized protein (DUF305 family)